MSQQEIENPIGEAGFSVSFKLYDSHGVEKLITMRAAKAADGEAVLRACNELTQKAIEKFGWSAGQNNQSSSKQSGNGHASKEQGSVQHKEFDATQLIKTFDDNGEMRIKLKGKPFEKFGVPIYEEDFHILHALDVDVEELKPGAHPFNHRVKAILKDDGNPRKVVEVYE